MAEGSRSGRNIGSGEGVRGVEYNDRMPDQDQCYEARK